MFSTHSEGKTIHASLKDDQNLFETKLMKIITMICNCSTRGAVIMQVIGERLVKNIPSISPFHSPQPTLASLINVITNTFCVKS